jgi:UDP-N-acetylglucosamine--N-acetylmuramyl-(pentapeptide) pyrophosphoryl-undecaprenol N-acetylglucosamine transferase
VSGGSQGARSLNRAVIGAAADLLAAGVQVLHVAGPTQLADVAAAAPAVVDGQPPYVLLPYADRMDLAYAAADLMVCRAGAMTCAELSAIGLPAVYVPLPHGNGEQRFNAKPVVDAGGGLMVADAELRPAWIRDTVIPLMTDTGRLAEMAKQAAALGRRDADERMADMVLAAADGARPPGGHNR